MSSKFGVGLVESFHVGFLETFFAEYEVEYDPWQEIEEILAAWDNRTLHERLTEDHFERLQKELQDGNDGIGSDPRGEDDSSDSETFMVHTPGSGIVDPGCARAFIGEETLKEHEEATGAAIPINRKHRVVTFKGFSGDKNRSIGVRKLRGG